MICARHDNRPFYATYFITREQRLSGGISKRLNPEYSSSLRHALKYADCWHVFMTSFSPEYEAKNFGEAFFFLGETAHVEEYDRAVKRQR